MLRRGSHHDHESIREPGLCEVGGRPTTGDLCGPLEHLSHRGEIQRTEERREPAAWRHSLLARDLQQQLAHLEPLGGVDPLGPLGSQAVLPDMGAVRLQIHVDDAGLVLHNRRCHAQDGVMGRAFWALAVGPRLAVRCKDGCQDAREGSLAHTGTDRRTREDPNLCPTLLRDCLLP